MVSFSSLFILAATAVAGVFAFPGNATELAACSGTQSGSGWNNGYYYIFQTDGCAYVLSNNLVTYSSLNSCWLVLVWTAIDFEGS